MKIGHVKMAPILPHIEFWIFGWCFYVTKSLPVTLKVPEYPGIEFGVDFVPILHWVNFSIIFVKNGTHLAPDQYFFMIFAYDMKLSLPIGTVPSDNTHYSSRADTVPKFTKDDNVNYGTQITPKHNFCMLPISYEVRSTIYAQMDLIQACQIVQLRWLLSLCKNGTYFTPEQYLRFHF